MDRNLIGQLFGNWTVVKKCYNSKGCPRGWLCICKCGNQCIVSEYNLMNGNSTRCKYCINLKHGKSRTSTYNTYRSMISRCYNVKNMSYHNYGGRGIRICQRWLQSIHNFIEDMGLKPDGKTLDRIDNDLSYYKDNCKWSTPKEKRRK